MKRLWQRYLRQWLSCGLLLGSITGFQYQNSMFFPTKPTNNQLAIWGLVFVNETFIKSNSQPAASQSCLKSDNILRNKNLHLHLAPNREPASKTRTWPLRKRQVPPPWKNSGVCLFFRSLSPGFIRLSRLRTRQVDCIFATRFTRITSVSSLS